MTFGKWLVRNRQAAKLTQAQLAERAGIQPSYVSALEREEPNAKDGSPRRPRIDKVDRIAKALRVPVDEARLAAGYAPTKPATGKPQSLIDLLERLERLGIENLHFADQDKLRNATPDELQEVLEAVKFAVELTLRKQSQQ